MNRVVLIGNLGRKPELRETKSGHSVANFSIATNERVKDGDQWKDHTEWHTIVVWGKQAENCEKFLDKGSKVAVEGKIRTRAYQDKGGNDRKSTEVVVDRVEFLTRADNGAGAPVAKTQGTQDTADDIPF